MARLTIVWVPGPGGNLEHIAKHELTPEDIEDVLLAPLGRDISRSSGRPIVYGFTSTGRYILVVYRQIDEDTVYPVTAYEL
ncbi:MAG: hypothetical protein R3C14_13800 [Caldilineaceae bacterium]